MAQKLKPGFAATEHRWPPAVTAVHALGAALLSAGAGTQTADASTSEDELEEDTSSPEGTEALAGALNIFRVSAEVFARLYWRFCPPGMEFAGPLHMGSTKLAFR